MSENNTSARVDMVFALKCAARGGPCFRERFRPHYVLEIQEYHLTLETIGLIF